MITISYQIARESIEQQFPYPVVVAAIVWKESKIKRLATGMDRDLGLMQVRWPKKGNTYATHKQNKDRTPNLYDSEENLKEGIARLVEWRRSDKVNYTAHFNCGSNLKSKLCRKKNHGLDYQQQVYASISRFLRTLRASDLS